MKKIISVLENKRSIAGIFLLAGLVFTTYTIQENSAQIRKLTNFESGVQTCFTRVNQTYTANLLADNTSAYLTQNFQNLTEECLAEGILSVENSFQKDLTGAAKQLSNLASNVHWFHEDILAPVGAKNLGGIGEARDVGARFEKIETTKDEILESTNSVKTQITNSLNQQKNIFYVSATLLVVLMLAEYMSMTKKRLSNGAREKEAQAELLNNGGAASVKVGEIIRVALEQNNLFNCSKLFANFHASAISDKGKNKMTLESLITPIGGDTKKSESIIDKLWEDDSFGVSADMSVASKLDDINLEHMCSGVVDLLAERLFSKGIQFDMNIPENLQIRGRQEELEQTIFHLFSYAINSTKSGTGEKNISVFSHKLGDVVSFDMIHSGAGFDESILKQRVGLDNGNSEIDLDLQICQSLLGELDAKVQLDNKIDQSGNTVGGRVKIIFKSGTNAVQSQVTSQRQLVDLKVGSKKDILANFAS